MPEALGDARDAWGVTPLNGGVWRTESGLHVGWKAGVAESINGALTSRHWLFVATLDPRSGGLRKLRRLDVLPATSSVNDSNIRAIAGSQGEYFAASLRAYDVLNRRPGNQTLFIGRLDDDSSRMEADLGWKSDTEDVPDIGWDGEAFAVHAKLESTGEIFVSRVTPEGKVLLPSARYGQTGSPGGTPLGYRMSTNPVSGMSYLFDAPGVLRGLSGHDRSGASVPWAAMRALIVVIPGLNNEGKYGNLSAEPEGGVWTAWTQAQASGPLYAGIAAHLTSAGEVDRWFVFAERAAYMAPAVSASSSRRVWIAENHSTEGINVYDYDDGTKTGRLLVTSPYSLNDPVNVWDTRDFYGFDWKDERWLSFSESRMLHIVKVHGDCTYASATPPAMQ